MARRQDIIMLQLMKWNKKLSGKAIAESTGISEAAISMYFNEQLNLSKEKRDRISNYIVNA